LSVGALQGNVLRLKEIAHDLGIGYHTVRMFIRSAKGKLGARNQLEVAILMHGGCAQAPAPLLKAD
jgi:DNA-binding CsgD family transcriptional regulator